MGKGNKWENDDRMKVDAEIMTGHTRDASLLILAEMFPDRTAKAIASFYARRSKELKQGTTVSDFQAALEKMYSEGNKLVAKCVDLMNENKQLKADMREMTNIKAAVEAYQEKRIMTSESEWICDECGYVAYYGYEDIAEIGAPVCPHDGTHMSFVKEYIVLPVDEGSAPLTHEQLQWYDTNGGACPFCQSQNVDFDDLEFGGPVYQKAHCQDCGAEWSDIYEQVGLKVDLYPKFIPEEK